MNDQDGALHGAGAPAAIVRRMSVEIARAMKAPARAQMLDTHVILPVFDTPEEFAASLKKERDGWAEFIRPNGIRPD